MISVIVSISLRSGLNMVLELHIFTNKQYSSKLLNIIKCTLLCSVLFAVQYIASYIIWTLYLGKNHPLPMVGISVFVADMVIHNGGFWIVLSSDLRSQKEIRNVAKVYLVYSIWRSMQAIPFQFLQELQACSRLEWALIFMIPFCQISACSVAVRIIQIKSETKRESVKFLVTTTFAFEYISFVTTRLFYMNQLTVYGILIVGLLLHLKECYQIIKLHRKVEEGLNDPENHNEELNRKSKVEGLVVSEFLEAMLPMIFVIAFTMAYYGPNSTLMKNVGNNYFGGSVIENLKNFYLIMLMMFSIDLFAMLLSGTSIYYFCKINLFEEFCEMMKSYWMVLLVKLPGVVTSFCFERDVNLGMDDTQEFQWLSNEGKDEMICNAVELSGAEKLFLLKNSSICLTD